MLLSVCVMLVVASQLSSGLHETQWEQWKIKYGKQYKDDVEEVNRRNIWEQNMKMIEIHNREAEKGKHSYKLGMNEFGDRNLKDMSVGPVHSRLSRLIMNKINLKMVKSEEVLQEQLVDNMDSKMASYAKTLTSLMLRKLRGELNNYWMADYILEEMKPKVFEYNTIFRALILDKIREQLDEYNANTRQLVLEEIDKTLGNFKASRYSSPKENNITGSLPKSIDYRKENLVTPVKNQGACGSCWAFSAAGALEGQLAKKTGRLLNISSQNLVDCVVEGRGCEGGLPDQAFEYVQENGYVYKEEDYPYVGEVQRCRFRLSAVPAQCKGFKWVPEGNERALAEALHEVGPLSVVISTSDEKFLFYKSGVYYNPKHEEDEFSHAMLLVGYGETARGDKYWTVKNSWGKLWGEEGYIHIARNRGDHCGISSEASYPLM